MKEFEPGHGFAKSDWDEVSDNPELTDAQLDTARPFAEVLPELAAKIDEVRRGRGRQRAPTKKLFSIRLDRDVVDAFRAKGDGWQSLINEALRRSLKLGRKRAA
jgi:uncharacterized protein (DUF4415 family)